MKRQWRAGRIILAVLLLSLAGFVFYVWPGVSWKLEGEKAIGFDMAKGLVYTVKCNDGKHELRGYDLWSGEQRKVVGLVPETSLESRTGIEGSISPELRKKRIAELWEWHLSPNKEELIAINQLQTNIQVVELTTGKVTKKLRCREHGVVYLSNTSIGFSRDGRLFAAQDKTTNFILIWNLSTGEVIDRDTHDDLNDFNKHKRGGFRSEIDLVDGEIAYSPDARPIIRDFIGKKRVFECSTSGRPRFFDNGQMVMFSPTRIDNEHKPGWYRRVNGVWQKISVELASGSSECDFVSYTDNLLVTDCTLRRDKDKPTWAPKWFWGFANRLFGFSGLRHELQFWDVNTGQLIRDYKFFEPSIGSDFDGLEKWVFISEDGRWLAREYENELTVCDTLERRSVWCWVVVVGLVLFALRWGWPRKMQLV